jgi:hypothetical protein
MIIYSDLIKIVPLVEPVQIWELDELTKIKLSELNPSIFRWSIQNNLESKISMCLAYSYLTQLNKNLKPFINYHYTRDEFIVTDCINDESEGIVLKPKPYLIHQKSFKIYNGIKPLFNTGITLEYCGPSKGMYILFLFEEYFKSKESDNIYILFSINESEEPRLKIHKDQ